ncbi:MAG TPA: hypothetical protein VIJ62_04995 [Rhizomicrobium sp.]
MTYHGDIDRNEINALAQIAEQLTDLLEPAERKSSERTALIEALAAFRERAARLAESGYAATGHPHEQARIHHRIGADSARKAIAAKIRALPLFEGDEAVHNSRAVRAAAREHAEDTDALHSSKRYLLVGGEI